MTILPKLIYRFSIIPLKIPDAFVGVLFCLGLFCFGLFCLVALVSFGFGFGFGFAEMDKLNFIWKRKRRVPRRTNVILKKKNKVVELTLLHFKTYYRPTVVNTVWY